MKKDLQDGEPHVQHILSAGRIGDNGADSEFGYPGIIIFRNFLSW